MINITTAQVAQRIRALSLKSMTGVASRVRPECLSYIASQISNGRDWIPPDVGDEVILIRLNRLAIAMPDRFFPEFAND